MVLPFPYSMGFITETPINNQAQKLNDLADANNQLQSARVINPLTQDYEINANGSFIGQSVVQTSVYLALFTTLNSSAVYGMGNDLYNVKIIGNNIQTQVKNIVERALGSLVSQGLVAFVNCTVTQIASSAINVDVHWIDLTINSAGQRSFTTNVSIAL